MNARGWKKRAGKERKGPGVFLSFRRLSSAICLSEHGECVWLSNAMYATGSSQLHKAV